MKWTYSIYHQRSHAGVSSVSLIAEGFSNGFVTGRVVLPQPIHIKSVGEYEIRLKILCPFIIQRFGAENVRLRNGIVVSFKGNHTLQKLIFKSV